MGIVGAVAGVVLIVVFLVDSFETTVLPRRVTHRFRFARLFYVSSWSLWRWLALKIPSGKRREASEMTSRHRITANTVRTSLLKAA